MWVKRGRDGCRWQRYAGGMRYPDGGGRSDRGRGQRPGGGPAVPGDPEVSELLATGVGFGWSASPRLAVPRWGRRVEIRDKLVARIAEAEHEGWLGEVEGLRVSLAGAEDKLAQVDALVERRSAAVQLGMPGFSRSGGTAGTPRPTS